MKSHLRAESPRGLTKENWSCSDFPVRTSIFYYVAVWMWAPIRSRPETAEFYTIWVTYVVLVVGKNATKRTVVKQ